MIGTITVWKPVVNSVKLKEKKNSIIYMFALKCTYE